MILYKVFRNSLRRNSSGITKFHLYKDILILMLIYLYNYQNLYNSVFYGISLYFIIFYSINKIYISFRTLPFYKIIFKILYRSLIFSSIIFFINTPTNQDLIIDLSNQEELIKRSIFAVIYLIVSNIFTRYCLRIYRIRGGNSRTILFWGTKRIFEKINNDLSGQIQKNNCSRFLHKCTK